LAFRGAGVYGPCGANVAISRKKGLRLPAARSMNAAPLRASTSVR
jgi:hypothetical protein